jgi:hypothetical protein
MAAKRSRRSDDGTGDVVFFLAGMKLVNLDEDECGGTIAPDPHHNLS